jgi:hypothetical protein
VWGVCATSYRSVRGAAGLQLAPDVRRGCLLPECLPSSSVQSPANVTFPGSTATADQRWKRQPDLISGASQNVSNKYYRCSLFLLNLTRSFRSKEISADALGTVLEQNPLSRGSGTGAVYSHLQFFFFFAKIVFPLASYSCAMEISRRPRRRLSCLPHPKSPSEKMAQYYQLVLRKWYVLLLPINECIINKARTALINQCVMLRQLSAGPFFCPLSSDDGKCHH